MGAMASGLGDWAQHENFLLAGSAPRVEVFCTEADRTCAFLRLLSWEEAALCRCHGPASLSLRLVTSVKVGSGKS